GLSGCNTARFAWNGPASWADRRSRDRPRSGRLHPGSKPFALTSVLDLLCHNGAFMYHIEAAAGSLV
ncbi:MAG TPA: hypothetical protein VGP28_08355, partial [Methylocella sp.]|nr:hypothetical protein [Methylocella sp.]